MRSLQTSLPLLVCCALSLAAEKERLTTDKKPLPDPVVERRIDSKLPLIGARLGGLPEEVHGQLWELKSDLETVKAAKRQMNDAGVEIKGYDYVAGGVAGSTRTLIDLEDGRVRRILLFFPGMTDDVAKDRMIKLSSESEEKPQQMGQNACIWSVDGTQYFAKASGKWEKTKPAEKGIYSRSPAKTLAGPAAIEVGVDSMDWFVITSCDTKDTLAAVREGRLVKGMRMIEAYLAMREHNLYRTKIAEGTEKWTWTKERRKVESYDVINTEYGSYTASRVTVQENAIMVADFKNGFLVTSSAPNEIPPK